MVPAVVVTMVMGRGGHVVKSKRHRFNEGVKTEAGEGHGAEPVSMDVAVFHALAEVLQSDLDQEAPDDPESGATICGEGLGQEMEEAEAEKEGSTEGQEQGKLTAKAVPHGFSHGGAEDGDEKKGKSGHHEAWAYRMSRGLSRVSSRQDRNPRGLPHRQATRFEGRSILSVMPDTAL